MAKILILPAGKTFIMQMNDDDLERIAGIVMERKSNFDDVVIACFYSGMVRAESYMKINKIKELVNEQKTKM